MPGLAPAISIGTHFTKLYAQHSSGAFVCCTVSSLCVILHFVPRKRVNQRKIKLDPQLLSLWGSNSIWNRSFWTTTHNAQAVSRPIFFHVVPAILLYSDFIPLFRQQSHLHTTIRKMRKKLLSSKPRKTDFNVQLTYVQYVFLKAGEREWEANFSEWVFPSHTKQNIEHSSRTLIRQIDARFSILLEMKNRRFSNKPSDHRLVLKFFTRFSSFTYNLNAYFWKQAFAFHSFSSFIDCTAEYVCWINILRFMPFAFHIHRLFPL